MKIAYCYPEPLPSTAARAIQVVHTCIALARQVEQVFFYIPSDSFGEERLFSSYGSHLPKNLAVCYCKKKLGPVSSNTIFNFHLRSQLQNHRPNILITRHLKTAQALVYFSIPLIFEAHEIFSEKKSSAKRNRKIERHVFAKTKGVMCLSQGLMNALQINYPSRANFSVVPSGTQVPRNTPVRPNPKGEHLRMIYVGTTRYRWKGIDTLLKAMELLPGSFFLEIVGGFNPDDEQERRVARLINQSRLKITGHLPPGEANSRLLKADLAIIPNSGKDAISRLYTSPLKLLEAMAAGVTVVASDLPSIREVVSEDQAVLVKPDDPVALAKGISKAAFDPDLRRRLSRNAFLRVQDFSWEMRAKKIVKFAEEVLSHAAL